MPEEHGRHFDIDGLLGNDPAAWEAFVRRFSPVVYAAVLRIVQAHRPGTDASDVEDIVQQVYVRIVQHDFNLLRAYDPEKASLSTYLTIIAGSTALNCLKRLGSAPPPVPEDHDAGSSDPGHDQGISLSEVPEDLLSPREHLVMRLLFDDGYEVAEVASTLDIAAQTVRALKHRAVTKLRAHFGVDESKESAV